MKHLGLLIKIIKISLFLIALQCNINDTQTVLAANLKYFDTSSNSFVTYSGNQLKYTYNNFDVSLSQPGILIDGTSLADYQELFVNELGITAYHTGNDILFSDNKINVLLSINSKTAWVNGTEQKINVAPVMVHAGDEIKYYVPTRFLAETFGFEYLWVSSSNTVKISKPFSCSVNGSAITNNIDFYKISYNNNVISTEIPVFNYNSTAIVPLKQIFEAAGCDYYEDTKNIIISKNSLKLTLEKNSKITYLNSTKIIAEDIPVQVKDNFTGKQQIFASIDFVTQMLGFETVYDSVSKTYTIFETSNTGNYSPYLNLNNSKYKKNIYYEWISENTVANEGNILSKVIAYPEENYDVIEIHGVSSSDVVSFFDNGMVILEINNTYNALGTQFYSEYNQEHLNYTLLTDVNKSTRLYFMAGPEDQWKLIEGNSCIKVIFYNNNLEYTESSTKNWSYPDDKLIIPLEEYITLNNISDSDNYLNKNFEIVIDGNHIAFFEDNLIVNPYYGVINSEIRYDESVDKTFVKIFTRNISAYSYTLEPGYLSVSIGRPKDIHSKIIVLDAGHGGIDPGASKNGIKEKDLNFKILNTYTKDLFASSDIKVYFTRESDVKIDLYERAAFAAKVDADMFISLHMNANNSSSVKGTEVFYSGDNNNTSTSGFNSALLAKTIVNNISTAINTKNRGATKSEFVVAKYNTVPAVLIELGYMTNVSELDKLKNTEFQRKTAEAIYSTVLDLFNGYFLR